ncbi:MAG: guanylate kinase [Ferruginibacter sp.]
MADQHQKILIITAPSGAGKTSITHYLLKRFPELCFSVSATTREARSNEQHGVDYYFLAVEDFQEKIKNKAFAEWEMVYEGKYYGTLKSELKRIWGMNRVPVLDIDVKGAIHVQQQYPVNTLSVFIDAPSIDELRKRLESRGTETADTIQTRISKASYEIGFKEHFNKIIINDQLDEACEQAEAIMIEFLNA